MITKRIICTCACPIGFWSENKNASQKELQEQTNHSKSRLWPSFHNTNWMRVPFAHSHCLWTLGRSNFDHIKYRNVQQKTTRKKMMCHHICNRMLIFFFISSFLLFIFIYVHKLIITINKVKFKSSMIRTAGLINKLKQIDA